MSAPPPRGSSAVRPTTTPTSPGRCWRPAWPSARAAAMSANGTPTCRTAGSAPRPAGAASRPAAISWTPRNSRWRALVAVLLARAPRVAGVEVGGHRELPAGRLEPELAYLGEVDGDLGAPGAVGAAEDRFAEGQVPAVAGDQLDLVVFGLCPGLVQGGEQPGGLALVSEHAAEGSGRALERRGGGERP